ncbi:uncharacterized protein LOC119583088 [Penaeus monodon]|uniref:uncharacterized protein LOC119583088 n=1 Tax=Penaeus monodon TaxID=6687 RepID=UPI0018A7667C|nr:uncharacterized protein LOC119583088 [Penaeus monodon]
MTQSHDIKWHVPIKLRTCLITPPKCVYKTSWSTSVVVEQAALPTNVLDKRGARTARPATPHQPLAFRTAVSADMGDISSPARHSCRRMPPKGQDTLTALICRKLRESGQDVVAALYDLREELSRCPSRKASVKLVRRTLSRAIAEGRRDQDTARDTQDDLRARPEELVPTIDQLLKEELKGEEEFEKEQKTEEAKGEEAQEEILAEGGLECGEDVPDHKRTTGTRPQKDDHEASEEKQLTEDSNDAPSSILMKENNICDGKGGNTQETAILNGVQIERVFPEKGRPFSHFYGDEDREIMSVRLVIEKNKCALYKVEGETSTKLGVFHADHMTKLKKRLQSETGHPNDHR